MPEHPSDAADRRLIGGFSIAVTVLPLVLGIVIGTGQPWWVYPPLVAIVLLLFTVPLADLLSFFDDEVGDPHA